MCQHENRAGKERREVAGGRLPRAEKATHPILNDGSIARKVEKLQVSGDLSGRGGGGKTDRFSVKCRPASTARSMRTM
jgi:ribosomal protein L3